MRIISLCLLAVLLVPAPSPGQDTAAAAVGQVEFGVRLTGISGDRGRPQRFRDLTTGPTVDRLRYSREREKWMFDAAIDQFGSNS